MRLSKFKNQIDTFYNNKSRDKIHLINTETELPLSVDMPASIVLEVTYAEPGVKGNTATNATKPAKVETGASVNVPLKVAQNFCSYEL